MGIPYSRKDFTILAKKMKILTQNTPYKQEISLNQNIFLRKAQSIMQLFRKPALGNFNISSRAILKTKQN